MHKKNPVLLIFHVMEYCTKYPQKYVHFLYVNEL